MTSEPLSSFVANYTDWPFLIHWFEISFVYQKLGQIQCNYKLNSPHPQKRHLDTSVENALKEICMNDGRRKGLACFREAKAALKELMFEQRSWDA